MQTFLDELVNHQLAHHSPENLNKLQIIVPHVRMSLYLQDKLGKAVPVPQWSPQMFTLEQWTIQLYNPNFRIPDNKTLLLELWTVYKSFFADETFEKFWNWGDVLLNDLNDLDLQGADLTRLFRYTADWLKLESNWSELLQDTAPDSIFWQLFAQKNASMQERFLVLWDQLPNIRTAFIEKLARQQQIYSGYLFRLLSENAEQYINDLSNQLSNGTLTGIYVVGFNRLVKTQQYFLSQLQQNAKDHCLFWFDSDDYYVSKNYHQAGQHYRQNVIYGNLVDLIHQDSTSLLQTARKNITMVANASLLMQTKSLTQYLSDSSKNNPDEEGLTAIIVPDENMLLSVLSALPESVQSFNVSLGFPAKVSTYQSLIDHLLALIFNRKDQNGIRYYYHQPIRSLMEHPYLYEKDCLVLKDFINRKNIIWISELELKQCFETEEYSILLKLIFQTADHPLACNSWLAQVICYVTERFQEQVSSYKIELELAYLYLSVLLRLEDLIEKYSLEQEVSLQWWAKMLMQLLSAVKLPFTGEPLEGIQLISLAQTQGLDFKHVFFFSMNEDIIPAKYEDRSLIPYTIRKENGLTTTSDVMAQETYLFYRLLHQAENIFFFYAQNSAEKTEKSRYLLQLIYEWQSENPDLNVKEVIFTAQGASHEPTSISIEKTPELIRQILDFLSKNPITPKVINTYLHCTLKFYYDYLLRLQSPPTVKEELDDSDLGSLMHRALNLIYQPYLNIALKPPHFQAIKDSIPEKIRIAYAEYYSQSMIPTEGKAYFVSHILEQIILQLIDDDEKTAQTQGLTLLALEKTININLPYTADNAINLKLEGRTDRIDQRGNNLTVIDYKSGAMDRLLLIETVDTFFQSRDGKNYTVFANYTQALIYAYLAQRTYQTSSVQSGFMIAKENEQHLKLLTKKGESPTLFTLEELTAVEIAIKSIVDKLLDTHLPFTQTEEPKLCEYCPYQSLCNRNG